MRRRENKEKIDAFEQMLDRNTRTSGWENIWIIAIVPTYTVLSYGLFERDDTEKVKEKV